MQILKGPDPTTGIEAGQDYAEHWAATHQGPIDDQYRADNMDTVLLDGMLRDYRLLDIGCGTGGFLRLAEHAREIVGIDFSQAMIEQAQRFELNRAQFRCCRFEDFSDSQRFDAIRLVGVFGHYQPWTRSAWALSRAFDLLTPGGVLVTSYVPPKSTIHWLKTLAFPMRTVVIPEHRFSRMTTEAGFSALFSIEREHSRIVFLRAGDQANLPR
jgi:2-polyprenyl-3-methyl-5-hydroxy-6-metoxy-1,4-benzoquinol methylase